MKRFYLAVASAIVTTMVAGVAFADTIRFWTTENQPERLAKQEVMAVDFKKGQATRLKSYQSKKKI